MAFARVVAAWIAALTVFTLWQLLELRAPQPADSTALGMRRSLRILAAEAGLLALLAGLWFASLGSGGAWLIFLLVGLLVELPPVMRTRAETGGPIRWMAFVARVGRIVLAGMATAVILTW